VITNSNNQSETLVKRKNFVRNLIHIRVDWRKFKPALLKSDGIYYFIAYGKMSSVQEWEKILDENKAYHSAYTELYGCFLMLAVNAEREKSKSDPGGMIHAPFKLVKNWLTTGTIYPRLHLCNVILTSASQTELAQLATKNVAEHLPLLSELSHVFEVLFLPAGLASKKENKLILENMTEEEWKNIHNFVCRSFVLYSLFKIDLCIPCSNMRLILTELGNILAKTTIQKILTDKKGSNMSYFKDTAKYFWLEHVPVAKCIVTGVLEFYLSVFDEEGNDVSRWRIWVGYLANRIPVQLLVVGEEKGWTDFVSEVQRHIIVDLKEKLSLEEVFRSGSDRRLKYNRLCDWYHFFTIFPEHQKKIPPNYKDQTVVFRNWRCSLLRAFIQVYSPELTKEMADNYSGFWKRAARLMKDDELLRIAIEIGSLAGVKEAAWPGFLKLAADGKTLTVLGLSKDPEITEYLQTMTNRLLGSGFLESEML